MHAKELLYQAMRRKRLDVPPPGRGTDIDKIINRPSRSDAEIKAARIEAAAQAKEAKEKKMIVTPPFGWLLFPLSSVCQTLFLLLPIPLLSQEPV